MSDEPSRPEKAAPPPGTPDGPASVREAMRPAGRYDPARGRRSSARRRRRPGPGRGAPPSARELTNPSAAREPTRQVELGEEVWTVFVKGSCTVGSGAGRGARVLSVGLRAPGERPDPEGTRYLVSGRLEDVDEEVLRGLVAEAGRSPGGASASSRRRRKPGGDAGLSTER